MSDTANNAEPVHSDDVPPWDTPAGRSADAAREAALEAATAPVESTREPEAPEAPAEGEDQAEGQPEDKPEEKPETEEQRRIARLAFEAREARRQARTLQLELERRDREAASRNPQAPVPDDVQRQIREGIEQGLVIQRFNSVCNDIYEKGTKEIPGFEDAIRGFASTGGLPGVLVEAAAEVGDAHHVLAYLGKNPDEAERIRDLPPHRMGAALAKVADKVRAERAPPPRTVSRAPAPIRPIGGSASPEPNYDTMPMADFVRIQDERDRKRRGY